MANSDFFSKMIGFNSQYTEIKKSNFENEANFDEVDFCQGEDVADETMSLFGEFESSNNASKDLFSFESNDEDFLF